MTDRKVSERGATDPAPVDRGATEPAGTVDVVVVGAGPAGSALAARLARRGLAVALLERTRFQEARVGESLAPSIQPLLRDLGCWDEFLALAPLPSWEVRSVWGDAQPQTRSFLTDPYGCGWHVDRRALDAMLAERAATSGAVLLVGTAVHACHRADDRWSVALSSGRSITGRVLVDATGRSARVARLLGAQRFMLDRLVAVAATVRAQEPDAHAHAHAHAGDGLGLGLGARHHLLVETVPDGWWYSAPLPSGQTVVMLMTDADLCRRAGLATTPAWTGRLDATSWTARRLAGTRPRDAPHVHPATSQRLRRVGRPSPAVDLPWLAVGDAALAVDPVSGSGVLRALRTAAAAADAIAQHLTTGETAPLEEYEQALDAECTAYLEERARYYAVERRWESPFWTRRRVLLDGVASAASSGGPRDL